MSNPTQDSGIPVLTEVILTLPRVAPSAASIPVSPPAAAAIDIAIPPFLMVSGTGVKAVPEAIKDAEADKLADIPVLQVEIESPPATIEHAPITGWLDEEWTRMEQKISERVLTQLLERLDTVLEERMHEVLAASLQRAVEEIKQGLQQTLGEVVSDAVAQEIQNIQFSKK